MSQPTGSEPSRLDLDPASPSPSRPFVPLPAVTAAPSDGSWMPRGEEPDDAFPVPWRWWEALMVFGLVQVAAVLAAAVVAGTVDERLFVPVATLAGGVILVGVALLWTTRRHPGQWRRLLGPARGSWADVGFGAATGIAAFLAVNLGLGGLIELVVRAAGGELPPVQQDLQDALRDPLLGPAVLGVAVTLVPLGEELLFRGLLFQALRRRLGLWPGIGLSGLAFGLSHVEGLAIVLLFPVGMILAWAFHQRGTLVAAVTAHSVFNLISGLGVILNWE